MGPDFPQLTLDLISPKPSIPNFLTQFLVNEIINGHDVIKADDYVNGLEDEIKKIQAFQRELPLSFLIVDDALRKLKEVTKTNEEKEINKSARVKLGFEEFEENNWMSSAQLWSPTSEEGEYEAPRRCEDRGAILSFTKVTDDDVPGLSLVPPGSKPNVVDQPGLGKGRTGGVFSGSVSYNTNVDKKGKPGNKLPYLTARKRRRCWSAELHRRFVDALEKLGGSQVATPKQIRDLMQVDELTNDEVKSHLQKYRLHVRKLSVASTTPRLSSDLDDRDELELGCSTMDLQHSSSPKGPLHSGKTKKCNSSSMEEDEEDESDGHSWKVHNHMSIY